MSQLKIQMPKMDDSAFKFKLIQILLSMEECGAIFEGTKATISSQTTVVQRI